MSTIVQLDSLGAPERLEVTARLLLDLREQLYPVQHAVKGGSRIGRHNMAAGPMWTVTLYSLHENPAGELLRPCPSLRAGGKGAQVLLHSANHA
jgi:hypothetical protein